MAESRIHVMMLPWSAFGHLIPFFKLSIALAKAGVRVSCISTPRNIQRLPKLPSNLVPLVHFVQLPLPSFDQELLPDGAEATLDVPFEKVEYLKVAYDKLQHGVKQLVANELPDWIICDFNQHWMGEISQEFQVKLIRYSVLSAVGNTFMVPPSTRKGPLLPESLTVPPEWVTFPTSVAFKRNEAIAFCAAADQVNASGITDFERLEKQAPKSVVFVVFGSECELSKDQVFELAFGLEESELPFLWALRKPRWASNDEDSLPVGFSERIPERGFVCMEWVPQLEILAHPSIGVSFTHSGWSSVVETLQFGHNLVVLPFNIDQPLIARFLVEKGLAIEVNRDENGSFTRNDIATSLRQAMVSEEAAKLRIKTGEVAAIAGNLKLHQDHYIGAFVQFLRDGIWKQT
ncbi:hypothetical protein VNO77_06905 [Canavalia gladiata]|uniref:UDP-rhamnose:rhamnosyltransferase 1 n=1 Tax=Canavalia gladiata TaxID=3824 RepID=A0AAN9MDR7_CANGL